MAHNIFENDQWVFNQNAAWHNLGKVRENLTPREAYIEADLNWQVAFGESQFATFNGVQVPIENSRTLYRMPTEGQPNFIELGSFGSDYEPVQNEVLVEIAEAFGDQVRVETCGSLLNGKKVIMTLRADTLALQNDVMHKYLAIMNGHDGLLALQALPTSTRIVCNNTLNLALKTGRGSAYIAKHYKNIKAVIEDMKNGMLLFQKTSSFFDESVIAMDNKKMNTQLLVDFYSNVWSELNPTADLTKAEEMENAKSQIDAWTVSMEIEMLELEIQEPTLWLAANSVTKGIQFQNPGRVQNGWQERRALANLVGKEQDKTCKVMQMALATI